MLKRLLRKFKKNKQIAVGLTLLLFMALIAIAGPFFTGDAYKTGFKAFKKPSLKHPMGTDDIGRDFFSRVILGARYSLIIGLTAVALALLLGVLIGSLAGYYGGLIDSLVMRLADVFLAFPYILGAIALMVVLGPGIYNVPIAIAIFSWASFARIYRANVLEEKKKEYILAAKSLGAGPLRVQFFHILPNAAPTLLIFAASSVAYAILGEAVLSFVGLGIPYPLPSWGKMLYVALDYVAVSPWMMLFPGLFLFTAALAFILLGDGLRDVLDPTC